MKKILRSLMLVGFLVCSACSWSSGDGHDDVDNQNNNQTKTENNENEKKSDESEKKSDESEKKSDETPQKEIEY